MRLNLSALKQVILFIFLVTIPVLLFSQQPDSIPVRQDSSLLPVDSLILQNDTSLVIVDSAIIRQNDSLMAARLLIDSITRSRESYTKSIYDILKANYFLNWQAKPVAMINKTRNVKAPDSLFYLLFGIAFILALFRFFFTRYFNNLFRVFFNSSLRQSQLTDQLLQEKLPSLFFNIVFVLTAGVYVYLLLGYFGWISENDFWKVVLYCAVSMAIIYFVKFLSLKFTGWVTGFRDITNTYVFVIFLINKILGVLLLPFTMMIAFAAPGLITASVMISLLLIGLMFLLRFFRSFGLLQHQLKISRLHFFMYVIGVEVLPLLLIYKGLVLLLSKNL